MLSIPHQDHMEMIHSTTNQMVPKQQLKTSIEVEAFWHEIGDIAQRLLQRQFTGKAVLHLNR
jgi:hypothetical protein